MSKIISAIVGGVVFLFFLPIPSFAATIKINEFSSADNPEWVELYSTESAEISLDGWVILLQDNPDTLQKFTLNANDTIAAGGYKVMERTYSGTNAWLRNPGDTIILKDATGAEVDSVKYGDVSGAVVSAPGSGQSAGRDSDGTGGWIVFTTPTKSSTNNSSTPLPTPTPSPTPTATPTSAPTPTPTPSLSPTTTPRPTTAVSSSSTPKPVTSSPTPAGTSKITTASVTAQTPENLILGVTDVSSTSANTKEGATAESVVKEGKGLLGLSEKQYLAGGLAVLGVLFLGISVFLFFKEKASGKISRTDESN